MSFQEYTDSTKQVAGDFYVPDANKIELLQSILSDQYGREVDFFEAQDIGTRLVSFYEVLAGDRKIIPSGKDDG